MKQYFRLYLCTFILALCILSCTKKFDEINTDPNRPTEAQPDFLLTTSIFESMNLFGGNMNWVIFFNYSQHFSGFQGEFQRYTYNQSSNSTYWKNLYVKCLQPVYQIEKNYSGIATHKNRVLIARVWKDYLFSQAVSIWGSIPLSAALNGTTSVPYTKEEQIYYTLLDDLKGIVDSLGTTGDKYSATADKIYGGDLLKWKKFANTLRLKLAIRISNPAPNGDPVAAKKVVEEVYANEQYTLKAQDETAASIWDPLSATTWAPLYDRVIYNYTANKATIPVVCESLVYYTVPYNDARITVYAQPAKQGPKIGQYFGQNIAYGGGSPYAAGITNPHTLLKQDDYSYIGTRFLQPNSEFVFMSYAEACFLKAEAALKGWWGNPNASQYYYEGIDASYNRYGLTTAQATAYKNTPGIKWGTVSDTAGRSAQFMDWMRICTSYIPAGDFMRQIVMQTWLAIPQQELDAWTLIRRTRLLDFEPQFATYDGQYAYVPQRILYPSDEYQTNRGEVEKALGLLSGPDDLFTKLWFALPNKKNPYLPY